MKTKKKSKVAVQLNMDVIGEILSRLRVKDLIRFKTVCKAWLELISSKDFIKLHLQRSSLRAIPINRTQFQIDCHRVRFRHSGWSIFSGSSCDGLVCLFNMKNKTIHIWNPALRSSACIPMKICPPDINCFWFGLHGDEYKLVLGTGKLEMHVIRPYIDSGYFWNSTQKLRDGYCYFHTIGTLLNGRVHWPVNKGPGMAFDKHWKILSYDLHREKVGEIAIPVDICSTVSLGEVNGCLSVLVDKSTKEFELWAMKEYGVEKSWSKMMVLDAETVKSFHGTHSKEVVLDDPAAIKSPLYGKKVYVESLVPPKQFTERLLRSQTKSCRIISEI